MSRSKPPPAAPLAHPFLTSAALKGLQECLSSSQIRMDATSLQQYGGDWTRNYKIAPSAIVFPDRIEEVQALVRFANREGIGLVPSGGRTGLSGGAVASRGELVVSFERMNAVLDFNAADRLVSCQAGVITQMLQDFAKQQGLFYPVDFASSGSSQIGGNIATNAGGIRVIRYGLTRDWVRGLRVVTGSGSLVDCNKGLIKNATGYDLRNLFIGSEGTLGFIVEADIALTQIPAPQKVMVLGVEDLHAILQLLVFFQSQIQLSAFEFFSEIALSKVVVHRELKRPFEQATCYYTLLEFDEGDEEVAMELFQQAVDRGWVSDGVISHNLSQAKSLWQMREGISESLAAYTPYKNDISVKISHMPEFLAEADRLVKLAYPEFEVCWYGHIGDGNLHLNILKPEKLSVDEFFSLCHDITPQIFALVSRFEGSISAEHGVGLLKKEFLDFTRSPEELTLMRGMKRLFDPKGVMNPGKLLPEATSA